MCGVALSFTAGKVGQYSLSASLVDSDGVTASKEAVVRSVDQLSVEFKNSKYIVQLGSQIKVETNTVGGASPLTYTFEYEDGTVVLKDSSYSSVTIKPTAAGERKLYVYAKDAKGNVESASTTIICNAALKASLDPDASKIYVGDSTNVTLNVTGGCQPLTYEFRDNEGNLLDSDEETMIYTPTEAGDYVIIGKVTDAVGDSVISQTTISTADPLEVELYSEKPNVIIGSYVNIKANVSGGFPTIKYKYTKDDGSSISGTTSTLSYRPPAVGDHIINVTVTDGIGTISTDTITVSAAVKPDVTLDSDKTVVYTGEKITFTATGTGGFDPASYEFEYSDGTPVPSHDGVAEIIPDTPGSYIMEVTYLDRYGYYASKKKNFTVADPLEVDLQASRTRAVVNEKINFNAITTGGYSTLTYKYALADGTAVSGSTGSTYYTPKAVGDYTLIVTVTDKIGTQVTASVDFTVEPALTINSSAESLYVNLGDQTTITSEAAGGYAPLTYSFDLSDGTPLSSNGNTAVFRPTEEGTHVVNCRVTDDAGHTQLKTLTIKSAKELSIDFDITQTEVISGTKVTYTTTAHDGFPKFTYKYAYSDGKSISGSYSSGYVNPSTPGEYTIIATKFDDGTVLASNGSRAEYTPEEAGSKKITVYAEDKAGNKASAYVTINAAEKLTASFEISDTEVVPNTTVSMTLTAEGGFPTLSYKFTASNGAKVTVSGNTATSLLTLAGDYEFTATVTDKAGKTVTFKRTVKVVSDLQVSFTASAYRIFKGDSNTFTAEATGGTEPITFSYAYADGTKITTNGNQAVISPENGGYYTVIVTAKDKYGNTATAQTNVMVEEVNELNNTSTISATTVPLGSSVTLTGSCTGGASPYTYNFYYKKARNSEWLRIRTDETSCKFTPTSATSYDIKITVTDRRNATVEKNFSLKAEKNLENTSTVSSDKIVVGKKIVITGSAAGGAGGYQYAFYYKKYNKDSWTVIGDAFTTKSAAFRPGTAIDYDVRIVVKAIPHKDSAADAPPIFSSECAKRAQLT